MDLLDPVDSMRLRATLEAMRAQREAKEQALAVAELRAAEADAAPPTPEVDLAPLPVSPGHLQQLAGAVKTIVSRLTANKVRPAPVRPARFASPALPVRAFGTRSRPSRVSAFTAPIDARAGRCAAAGAAGQGAGRLGAGGRRRGAGAGGAGRIAPARGGGARRRLPLRGGPAATV